MIVMQITVGVICGAASGYALKKISKVGAFVLGVSFIGYQVLRYHNVVDPVDWDEVHSRLLDGLDDDGDGRITVRVSSGRRLSVT